MAPSFWGFAPAPGAWLSPLCHACRLEYPDCMHTLVHCTEPLLLLDFAARSMGLFIQGKAIVHGPVYLDISHLRRHCCTLLRAVQPSRMTLRRKHQRQSSFISPVQDVAFPLHEVPVFCS